MLTLTTPKHSLLVDVRELLDRHTFATSPILTEAGVDFVYTEPWKQPVLSIDENEQMMLMKMWLLIIQVFHLVSWFIQDLFCFM